MSLICRRAGALALGPVLLAVLLFSVGAARAVADSCPNAQFRYGYGANLPDCRAYEQATPVDKDGNNVQSGISGDAVQAGIDGSRITFFVPGGVPGATGAGELSSFLATRGTDGWSTQGILPPAGTGQKSEVQGWTPDLTEVFDRATKQGSGSAFLARDTSGGSLQTIAPYTSFGSGNYAFVGASTDDSMVFFEAIGAPLTPDSVAGEDNLYVWSRNTGKLSLVGVLPDSACAAAPCLPSGGSFAGPFNWEGSPGVRPDTLTDGGAAARYYTQDLRTVSTTGDRAFFTVGGTGQIYLREGLTTATPSTLQVSASQRTTPDPSGVKPAIFMGATASGSEAFFTSCEKLTNDSTAVSTTAATSCDQTGTGQDLYAYDVDSGQLTDLTVDSSDPLGAAVQGVVGISADGSYMYFVANGVLATNTGADGSTVSPGTCTGLFSLTTGQCNLYVWHNGAISYIARLDTSGDAGGTGDALDWTASSQLAGGGRITNAARVDADGGVLLFSSQIQLTAYNNQGDTELYRYDATSKALSCVSCDPTGAAPTGSATLQTQSGSIGLAAGAAITLRNLSTSGDQVFFESPDALVPADTNGVTDVYEWEAPGAGSCNTQGPSFSQQDGGCLYLLSTGKSPDPSYFADASASGDDAFIFTDQPLVGQDQDQLVDIYDARVDGGLASQEAQPTSTCVGDACRAPAELPPPSPTAATVSFAGPGDLTSGAAPAKVMARATVLTKTVRGTSFQVSVRVPGKGRISLSAADVRTVRRSVSTAGVDRLEVRLTSTAGRRLAHRDQLRLKLRVTYTPTVGHSVSVGASIAVKSAIRHAQARTKSRGRAK